ncbi:hypothetical protein [Psychrobacter sp. WY6]|uniref:hypothetical protein n=1 Tax=Psychrobacter sp. WY6 TaxID=2708350 RepID=UPI002022BB7C|nr:hypothetical protein [Psychrobacter sp. WY6]
MIYLTVSVFTLLSILMMVILFDRQLCGRLLDKVMVFFHRLPSLKFKRPSIKTPKKVFHYRIKQFIRFISDIDVSRIPVISALFFDCHGNGWIVLCPDYQSFSGGLSCQ